MILDLFAKFNFLDFIILIVAFRICYIAAKTGLSFEIFKFLGVIFSIYIALHYYVSLSDLIQRRFFYEVMPVEFMDFLIFILLILIGYLFFVILRNLLSRFIKLDPLSKINQLLGLILGIGRGYLVIGLVSFILVISSVSYLSNSVKHSYLGSRAILILPQEYGWLWNNIFSKFFTQEKYNSLVTNIVEKFNRS